MPPEIARSMVNFGARGRDSLSNPVHVRFGSLADICSAKRHVRFTPNSDIDCVFRHDCFGPIADIKYSSINGAVRAEKRERRDREAQSTGGV
jgi:hypothetical protein